LYKLGSREEMVQIYLGMIFGKRRYGLGKNECTFWLGLGK
jgi:hypothetical protein